MKAASRRLTDGVRSALRASRSRLRAILPSAYDAEVGGYVHDTAMSQFFGPNQAHYVTGVWADAAGQVTDTICKAKTAADNTGVATMILGLPQNSAANKGAYLKSVDVYFEVRTAALEALSAQLNQATLPADGAAFGAVTNESFSYDAGHDDAAERVDVDQHTMTLTPDTPFWLDDDSLVMVELTVDAAATSVFEFYGCRANYTLRL